MGMANYLQKFAPGLSELTKPIRDLLRKGVEFVWEESVHGECFTRVKAVIASAAVLKFFDASEKAVLQCGASQHELGIYFLCYIAHTTPVSTLFSVGGRGGGGGCKAPLLTFITFFSARSQTCIHTRYIHNVINTK